MLVIYFDYLRVVRLCEPLYCDTSKSYDRCCIATMVLIGGILFSNKISKRCRKRQRCCWWDFAIYHLLGYLQPQMGERAGRAQISYCDSVSLKLHRKTLLFSDLLKRWSEKVQNISLFLGKIGFFGRVAKKV